MSNAEAGSKSPAQRRGPLIIGVVICVAVAIAAYFGYQWWASTRPGDVNRPSSLGDMALGPADAPVKIIEYASMDCPHCAAFTKDVFPKLKAAYVDTGKVRYIFREYPLQQHGLVAAVLARCIAKSDAAKFFNVVDVLFASQDQWLVNKPLEPLKSITKQFGMNDADFEACLDNRAIGEALIDTRDYAYDHLKVDGTPSFFINGQLVVGEASPDEFAKIIDPLLAKSPAAPTAPKS
jgi:protein-disulfide isomerase